MIRHSGAAEEQRIEVEEELKAVMGAKELVQAPGSGKAMKKWQTEQHGTSGLGVVEEGDPFVDHFRSRTSSTDP